MSAEPRIERLGDYDVVAPIAEGGMASVWLGRRAGAPAEFVALKVIRAEHARNKEFVAMLRDEAGIASRLSHPNIVGIRGFGDAQDGAQQPYLVMELLRGHSLLETFQAVHARGKRLPAELVAWLGARVADALHYAHELTDEAGAPLRIVHRDVNPANIFLTSEGVPKLIDFGLAKARDRITATAIGVVKGKLAYLAPEQARGQEADRRADVFALGVTLWELALDRRLFHEETDVQTVRKVMEGEVPDPRAVDAAFPPALADALMRALAKDPTERWQTAAELRDALDAFAKSRQVDGAPQLRGLLTETFAGKPPADWERTVDEVVAENLATRLWERVEPASPPEAKESAVHTQPLATLPAAPKGAPAPRATAALPRAPLAVVAAVAAAGAVVGGLSVRACGARGEPEVERRVARLETLLGVPSEAGAPAPSASASAATLAVVPSADEAAGVCAQAKVTAYRAWQEAYAKAKTVAQPAEAQCAGIWNESHKQACYGAAMAPIRAAQAARDAIIEGGPAARDAVRAVKDDAKNDAISRARTASLASFDACGDDAGP